MAAILKGLPPISDDDLVRLSQQNPGWKIERTDDGELRLSPTHTDAGAKSMEAAGQLRDYRKQAGGKVYDSSTGFKTPKGGVLSPDAAWIARERVALFSPEQQREYRTITPDVVIEVKSDSDDWRDVKAKIDRYRADGAVYAVAIDPDSRDVYETGSSPLGLNLDFDAIIDA